MKKDIIGFENYTIDTEGKVFSKKRNKYLKPQYQKCGYLTQTLFKNRKPWMFYIHRLVAIHFVENPHNYKEVNHINGNKHDNRVENIEWCSRSENCLHSFKVLGRKSPYYYKCLKNLIKT